MLSGGVYLDVRTRAPLFNISETAEWIVLKFGLWLVIHFLGTLERQTVGCIRTCAVHVQTLFPYPRSLVHRRIWRLTGYVVL